PLASILYSVQAASAITDTLICGKFVKRNGKLMLNEREIVENASHCAKEIYTRGKGTTKLYF
ncbi:MAG: hypothetical protein J6K75_06065, partial [Erysipelotrichaceae bacterium]|nr:hypothetical protein [Erysipelotrichaceae bacterium]